MKLFFMGTAAFAVPSLEALVEAGHEIRGVVCQPDRPRGRGHHLQAPAVKVAAQKHGLEIFQPENAREAAFVDRIKALDCDLGCVVAYGQILDEKLLFGPRLGCVNLHASLLPRWRGAAPVEWALAEGDDETGVSVQRMVRKLDAGEVLASKRLSISPGDDAEGLLKKLAPLGAGLLVDTLAKLEQGPLRGQVQDESKATYAPLLTREHGLADFGMEAERLASRCRAFQKRPGFRAWLQPAGQELRLFDLFAVEASGGKPGEILDIHQKGWTVACKTGSVLVPRVQSAGGKRMEASAWARGHGVQVGMSLQAQARG